MCSIVPTVGSIAVPVKLVTSVEGSSVTSEAVVVVEIITNAVIT